MDLLAAIGCACAGLLAVLAVTLLVVVYRLGLLYQLWHKHLLLRQCVKNFGVSQLGRIGVAAVTAGPGVTNTVTAIKNAQMAESPLLLIGGAAASLQKGRGALQDIDQLSLFKTLCKACVSVRAVRDIVPTLRKAIATAQSGTPVFGAQLDWFKDPIELVQRCAELVSRATKPLVLVGSQAMLPPTPAEELREKAVTPTPQHLNPLDLLHRLDALLPPESLLVADGGDFVGTAAYIVRPRRPLAWLDPGAFGTLGVGGGFALGAKLCRPAAGVWVLYGDGSLGYSVMEFDTFVRHKTPVIALVGNDACWSQISREQVALLGSNVACGLEYLDYHAVAEALGGKGFVVGRPDCERLEAILRAAQDACRQGRPVLINALIGKTNFRDGSISV
ncbi:2-hydroxyacyl-CoA lyase 2 [Egretta garzetta]|uniref:2-hydroxyacyl-CoA lyase 2 n=1 Tax=Egretta garzetta TaxID=188379 RepID=UPI00051EF63A|nr:2-hydroxyacyl-CoA lyase 2 [Egretta garzetta]